MSFTEAEHVFAGLHEGGANDLLQAFFTTLPRYFNYRSSPSVAAAPAAAWTAVPPISFPVPAPGVPATIDYAVQFDLPRVDFYPPTTGPPPPLVHSSGEFSIKTSVSLTLLCKRDRDQRDAFSVVTTRLEVWALGSLTVRASSRGAGQVGFDIREVEIVDISPDHLEAFLECLILMLLRAALSAVRLPFDAVSAGAFQLVLLRGPEVEDDQGQLYGEAS